MTTPTPPRPVPVAPLGNPLVAGGRFAALEAEITELWAHISAATYRFLVLVAELDDKEAWGDHGCCSCAHWLNWRCGIGMNAAREKVRVARALKSLPLISRAFAAGQISYSKARALTRIALPETEEDLLNVALHGTAAHVEKLLRLYRRTERLEAAEAAFGVQQSRYLSYYFDESGFVIHARLPAEVGALLRQALEAAEQALFAEARQEETDVSAETSDAPARALRAADGVSAETPPADRPRHLGHACTPRNEAERADNPAGARRADALRRLAEHFLAHPPETGEQSRPAEHYMVNVHIDQALLTERAQPPRTRPARCELDDARVLAAETAKRLGCDGTLVGFVDDAAGEPLSVGRKTRAIPPAIRRALAARDGGACRFPGCTRSRYTEGHHVEHWADGGETKLSNLVTLCRFHHRLVHEGGFGLKRTDDGAFVFTRPNGTRIGESGALGIDIGTRFRGNAPAGEPAPPDETETARTLERLNAELGLEIDANTCRTRWGGERMDYGWAIACLIRARDMARLGATTV